MEKESKEILEAIQMDLVKALESEDNKFYFPPEPLATRLVKSIEADFYHDLRELDHQITDVELQQIPFVQIIDEDDSDVLDETISNKNLLGFQRRISKEIYFYLDFLSRNVAAGTADSSFDNYFSYEMGKVLGLPKKHLEINTLTKDFILWISKRGSFSAGWGTIDWDEPQIVLQSFSAAKAVAVGQAMSDNKVIFNIEA